jgi:antitoxin HicB
MKSEPMNNEQAISLYHAQVNALSEQDGGGFEALFPQIARSVVGYGETRLEAVHDLLSAVPAYLQVLNETQQSLPSPETRRSWEEFSGKFNVRVPKTLHARLAQLADQQSVSLNSLVLSLLAEGAAALNSGPKPGAKQEAESTTGPRRRRAAAPPTSGTRAR